MVSKLKYLMTSAFIIFNGNFTMEIIKFNYNYNPNDKKINDNSIIIENNIDIEIDFTKKNPKILNIPSKNQNKIEKNGNNKTNKINDDKKNIINNSNNQQDQNYNNNNINQNLSKFQLLKKICFKCVCCFSKR